MRAFLFMTSYWVSSVFFALTAVPLLLIPHQRPIMVWIQTYCRLMVFWMRVIGGIKITVKGKENLPDGPFILAAKHQSWGDGFAIFSNIDNLSFVIGDHMLKYPIVKHIFAKLGSVVVNSKGAMTQGTRRLIESAKKARENNQPVLIFPEGSLTEVGKRKRYKSGIHHIQRAYGGPIVPVANSLGLGWPKARKEFHPGPVVIEFLPPIEQGLERAPLMEVLEKTIEEHSLALLKTRRPDLMPQDGIAPIDEMD